MLLGHIWQKSRVARGAEDRRKTRFLPVPHLYSLYLPANQRAACTMRQSMLTKDGGNTGQAGLRLRKVWTK